MLFKKDYRKTGKSTSSAATCTLIGSYGVTI